MRCLHEDFVFQADEYETSSLNADAWKYENWDYRVEQDVMSRLFTLFRDTVNLQNQIIELELIKGNYDDVESPHDSVIVFRDYELKIYHNYPDYPSVLSGTHKFILKEDQTGFWSISFLQDIKKEITDLGELKGLFRY